MTPYIPLTHDAVFIAALESLDESRVHLRPGAVSKIDYKLEAIRCSARCAELEEELCRAHELISTAKAEGRNEFRGLVALTLRTLSSVPGMGSLSSTAALVESLS